MPSVLRRAITALSLLTILPALACVAPAQSFNPFDERDPFTDPLPARPKREVKPRPAVEIPPAAPVAEALPGETRVQKALRTPTTLDFIETPLEDIVEFIGELHGVNVELDERELEDIGLAAETPLTFSIRRVTLRSALRLLLKEIEAEAIERDDALVITSQWAVETELVTRVYSLRKLLPRDWPRGDEMFADESIMALISATVAPDMWEEVGGPGSMHVLRKSLIVSNTPRIQEEVAALLKTLERARGIVAASRQLPPKGLSLPEPPPWQIRIEKALGKEVEIDFQETALEDAVDFLSDKMKIAILLDESALEDVGIGTDIPITRQVKHVSLRAALRLMLREMDLTYVVMNEVLLITTWEEVETSLQTRMYPVVDLVLPPAEKGDWLAVDTWRQQADYDALIELMTRTIRPDSWSEVGGPGSVVPWEGCLVVSQTDEVLSEIEDLLAGLRSLQAKMRADRQAILTEPLWLNEVNSPQVIALRKKLSAEIGMAAFKRTNLHDVVRHLGDTAGVPIQIDHRALGDVGLDYGDLIVTATLGGETLEQALRRLLRPFDLVATIRDEVIMVTTPEECECSLLTCIYPVADLVLPSREDELEGELHDFADADFFALMDAVSYTVRPDTWEDVGGPGAMTPYSHILCLVVAQTPEVHGEVVDLLAKLRAAEKADRQAAIAEADAAPPAEDEDALRNKQGQRVRLRIYRLAKEDQEESSELAETIAELVQPQSWKSDKAHYLKALSGAIIVRHTPDAQRKIKKLLETLDVLQWPQFGDGTVGGGTGEGFKAGGGGFFAVPDHIRGQFGGIGFGGEAFGITQPVRPYITLPELSLPANDDQPALPLRVYHISSGEDGLEPTIRELIDPNGWQSEGQYLRMVAGKLIARTDVQAQRKIYQLLVELGMIVHERPAPGFSGGVPVVGKRSSHAYWR